MRTRLTPIDEVRPYPGNPIIDHDVERIARSIRAFDWQQPLVAYEPDGFLLAGHGRLKAARELGVDRLPVKWVTADEMTPEQARAYRLADNESARRREVDDRLVLEELALLDEARRREAGYDEDDEAELRRRAREVDMPEPGDQPVDDAAPTVFGVLVSCATEGEQFDLLRRFLDEGLSCKALT